MAPLSGAAHGVGHEWCRGVNLCRESSPEKAIPPLKGVACPTDGWPRGKAFLVLIHLWSILVVAQADVATRPSPAQDPAPLTAPSASSDAAVRPTGATEGAGAGTREDSTLAGAESNPETGAASLTGPAPASAETRDPAERIRRLMEQGLQKQRDAIRRQWEGIHGRPPERPFFFTNPWPAWPSWPPPSQPPAPESVARVFPDVFSAASTVSHPSLGAASPLLFPCEPVAPAALAPLISSAASRHGLPPRLIESVIGQESAGHPCAVSRAGAMGLMQLMPETAHALGVLDPFDPAQNIDGGTRFLKSLLERFGDLGLALGAYNAGPGAVEAHGGLPPFRETRNYVSEVLRRMWGAREPLAP